MLFLIRASTARLLCDVFHSIYNCRYQLQPQPPRQDHHSQDKHRLVDAGIICNP